MFYNTGNMVENISNFISNNDDNLFELKEY